MHQENQFNTQENILVLSQAVYYKCNHDIKCKGIGKTVGQDGLVVYIKHGGFLVKIHCPRIKIADSLFDTIPQDNINSQLHSKALQHQTNELNKNTGYTSSDVYIDSDSGDQQYSINLKETSFDNKIKEKNSKMAFTYRSTHIRFT